MAALGEAPRLLFGLFVVNLYFIYIFLYYNVQSLTEHCIPTHRAGRT
jgi:hypothetical protein